MIEKVYFYISENNNPYHNQAIQNYIFNNIPDNSMVFLLWQDNDTISIGNKESIYRDVNISEATNERCYFARRESVGKCIYTDLGTINYGFFLYLNNYNIVSQINVLYQALHKLNLPVYLDSNNELLLEGKQISDNIYLVKQERCYHQGALYWDSDKSKRGRYLKDNNSKKNISNITDYNPCVNLMDLKRKILQSLADCFGKVYQLSIEEDLTDDVVKYQDYRYIFDSERKYTLISNDQYDFGNCQLYIEMLKNRIIHVDVYLHEDNDEVIETIKNVFEGLTIDEASFRKRLEMLDEQMANDVKRIWANIKKDCYPL